MSERVEPRNVTLYPSDWAIVQRADKSSVGISATLRRIIREWNDDRHQRGAPPHTRRLVTQEVE